MSMVDQFIVNIFKTLFEEEYSRLRIMTFIYYGILWLALNTHFKKFKSKPTRKRCLWHVIQNNKKKSTKRSYLASEGSSLWNIRSWIVLHVMQKRCSTLIRISFWKESSFVSMNVILKCMWNIDEADIFAVFFWKLLSTNHWNPLEAW